MEDSSARLDGNVIHMEWMQKCDDVLPADRWTYPKRHDSEKLEIVVDPNIDFCASGGPTSLEEKLMS